MSSNNTLYLANAEGQVVRIPNHACLCDECKLLDAQDAETLQLAHEYLEGKMDKDTWWDRQMGISVGDLDVAINRFHHALEAKEGPISLSDAIESIVWCDWEIECGRTIKNEQEFKIALQSLIRGYEVRQRTVHLWKVVPAPKTE